MVSRISAYQAILLLIIAVVPTAILSLPPLLTEIAGEDASIVTVISPLLMMTSAVFYVPLLKAMGRTDIITFAKKGLGTIIGIGLGLSIAGGYTLLNGLVIRQLSEVMAIAYLPETPLWFVNATLIAVSSYAVFLGIETIARTTEIAFPFFVGFFLLVILFLIPDMNLAYLRPLFSQGIMPIAEGVFAGSIFYSEIFILLILGPQLRDLKEEAKVIVLSLLGMGVIIFLATVTVILVFDHELTRQLAFPFLSAARYVRVLGIVQNLDPGFLAFWIGGGVIKVAIFQYVTVYIAKKVLNISTAYLILLTIPGMFLISHVLVHSYSQLLELIGLITPYFLGLHFGIPVLLLGMHILRDRRKSSADSTKSK